MANISGEVFILKTSNRATGVPALLSRFALQDYSGKKVALKANFNSADPFPASTHLDTLRAIVETLKNAGANRITWVNAAEWATPRRCLSKWAF